MNPDAPIAELEASTADFKPAGDTIVVDVSGLEPVGTRPPLGLYLRQLWSWRHFILADSHAKASTANRDKLLGNAWLVGKPILDGFTYFFIFGVLLGTRRGVENFISFLLVGVFLFSYTSRALNGGATVLLAGRGLIKAFRFPRAAIPLAMVVREALKMGPVILTLLLATLIVPPHAVVTWRWLLFPLVFLLQTLFNAGVVLYSARMTNAVPDLRMTFSFISRLWLYGSGVMFSIYNFVSNPTLLSILEFNPMHCVLTISRDLLVYGVTPEPRLWITLSAWAVVTPILAFVYFWQGEEEYDGD